VSPAAPIERSQALNGKHAVVTGGSRGIGAAIARSLLGHGARVSIFASSETAPDLSSFGHSIDFGYIKADVTDVQAVAQAFDRARQRFGEVAILVNNAGRASPAPFLKTGADVWRQMMAVNLDGTFYCTQAALPDMLAAGWGRIVNIASTAGLTGAAYVTAYSAAKHGVVGLTRSLAVEVAPKGVTVNAVCPGYTETDMVKNAVENIVAKTGRSPEAARAELLTRNPLKRFVRPEEVANAVAWLCLPGSDAVTGQAVTVAGGEVM
jgi:NAD(P)-dependent dehydrogenase (short-subunit alcohol dehydrogenase family)